MLQRARSRRSSLAQVEPLHLLAVGFVVVSLAKMASLPLVDPDAPWHVLLGKQILSGTSPWNAGRGWTFAPIVDRHWVSTQWLAEVLMAVIQGLGGWNGLLVFRVFLVLALQGVLAVTLLPGRPARAAVPVFVLVAGPIVMGSIQERPQSISYLLLVPVSWWALSLVHRAVLPSAWIVVPLAVLWANLHGLWVLLPSALALAAIGRLLDHGIGDRPAHRALLLASLSFVAGVVSPAGLGTLTAAWRFRQAAKMIIEWQPVNVISPDGALLVTYAAVVVVAWSRGAARPRRSELVFVGAFLVFGLTAYRNIPTALLLTAPFVLERVQAAWSPQRVPTSRRERRRLAALGIGLVGVSVLTAVSLAAIRNPFPTAAPVSLAEAVAGRPEAARVIPDSNEGGWVLSLSQPGSRTAIDGRADFFGESYIRTYMSMLDAGAGWESTVRRLNPTSAILNRTTPLAEELQRCGWRVQASTTTHLLLVPTPSWTCPANN